MRDSRGFRAKGGRRSALRGIKGVSMRIADPGCGPRGSYPNEPGIPGGGREESTVVGAPAAFVFGGTALGVLLALAPATFAVLAGGGGRALFPTLAALALLSAVCPTAFGASPALPALAAFPTLPRGYSRPLAFGGPLGPGIAAGCPSLPRPVQI